MGDVNGLLLNGFEFNGQKFFYSSFIFIYKPGMDTVEKYKKSAKKV